MTISSSAFDNYANIPDVYTCEGEDINPPLTIRDIPPTARSLVLIVDDPDAPGGLFTHWLLWNIPPDTDHIDEDSTPPGAVEGENSSGEIGYMGPCPPSGVHHYRFMLWALSDNLSLDEDSTREEVEAALEQYVLARAEWVGQYQKGKS